MQKLIENSYFDWSRAQKPTVQARGIAAIVVPQFKSQSANAAPRARCVWPSGLNNVDSRYLTRKVWSR